MTGVCLCGMYLAVNVMKNTDFHQLSLKYNFIQEISMFNNIYTCTYCDLPVV